MSVSASRKARIELTASSAGMDSGLRDARRKMRQFERDQAKEAKERERATKRATHAAFGLGRSLLHGAAAAAGFDVAGGIGGLVSDVFDTEKELTRFQIDAQLSTEQVGQFRRALIETSEATGVSRNALVRGAHAYQILTGDAAGAVQASRLFADVANASGASMEDIAATAASLRQNLGFDPSQFRQGFDVLLTLGHKGSVELRDLASQMAGLAPQFKDFGDKAPTEKLVEMGAAMQVIRKNFGSSEEMATGLRALMTALSKKGGDLGRGFKLGDFGVNVFRLDPKTKKYVRRDFLDIVHDIIKNPALNEKVLPTLLGRQEAVRALDALRDHWGELEQLQTEAANSNQVSKDATTYMASASGKLARAWEHIKNAIANALTPERIDNFANALIKAADAFSTIVHDADLWIQSVGHMFGGGGGNEVEQNTALQELFLNNTKGIGENATDATEKSAIANAKDIIANPEKFAGTQWAHDYGGVANIVAAAQRYLKSEGISYSSFDVTANRDTSPQQQIADMAKLMNEFASGKFSRDLANAIAGAIGAKQQPVTVKVGAEPVVKAYGQAVSQRTRPGGR